MHGSKWPWRARLVCGSKAEQLLIWVQQQRMGEVLVWRSLPIFGLALFRTATSSIQPGKLPDPRRFTLCQTVHQLGRCNQFLHHSSPVRPQALRKMQCSASRGLPACTQDSRVASAQHAGPRAAVPSPLIRQSRRARPQRAQATRARSTRLLCAAGAEHQHHS